MSLAFKSIASALTLLALCIAGFPAKAQETPQTQQVQDRPQGVVAQLNGTLLEVMQAAETLGYQGRYERLDPVLRATFNFPVMARISIGRHWSKLDEAQQARMAETFARMSVATFAARFDGFSGERFEVLGEEEGLRKTILVRNHLILPDGEVIPLNYLFRKAKDRWRAVDVYLDAKFSELATKRSEYSAILGREGFDGLIAAIERKIEELKSGAETG